MQTISILENFSEFPGLRHCNISEDSGEEFYHKLFNEAFKEVFENSSVLTVTLDNTAGFASSFLDEAFGNLVYDFTLEVVKKHIKIISAQEPHWKEMIENQTFIQWEKRRITGEQPQVTALHTSWYRLKNGTLLKEIWEKPAA